MTWKTRILVGMIFALVCSGQTANTATAQLPIPGQQTNPCDLNHDGKVDDADVQLAVQMSISGTLCPANIAGPGVCNAITLQRVINASLGQKCLVSTGLHVTDVAWTPNPEAVYYEVLRGDAAGGPYQTLASKILATRYLDTTVESGKTYFYVVIAVDGKDRKSNISQEVRAVIPLP